MFLTTTGWKVVYPYPSGPCTTSQLYQHRCVYDLMYDPSRSCTYAYIRLSLPLNGLWQGELNDTTTKAIPGYLIPQLRRT